MTKNCVKLAAILIFTSLFHHGNPANILALMGCASKSHHLWNEVIYDTLAARGHTLTIVSVDKTDSPNDNISYIHLEGAYTELEKQYNDAEFLAEPSVLTNVRMLSDFQMVACRGIVQSTGYKEALELDEEFDLILFDIANGPCLLRLIQKFPNVPVVAVTAFKLTPDILQIVGGHNYPSYVPLYMNRLDVPMGFWQRLYNTATYAMTTYYRNYVSDPIVNSMTSKQFPGPKPSLDDLYKRIDVVLSNTHPALDNAQSLPPSVIQIGGLHIKDPRPLPEDIKKFIESSEWGTVLISLGTNIKAEVLGEERLQAFINVIQKFPKFNFLWKVETDGLLKTLPPNLMTRKWLPQNDILANPKVKAFLTHAGGLSIQEATWYGVPVLAMPFFIDQMSNAHRVQLKGYGRVIDFATLTEASLYQGISGVLTDETYRLNMVDIQKQFRDRQNKPLDTAIWWIEYALRNPKLDHLISPSRDLSYFVANSLDVIFIGVTICAIFLINTWIVLRNIKGTLATPKVKAISKVKSSTKRKVKSN